MDNNTKVPNSDETTSLRAAWKELNTAHYEAARMGAKADELAAKLQQAILAVRARRFVPMGYDIDYLGDGKVKPADQCAKVLKETLDG